MYATIQTFRVSIEMNTFIQQGCIKLIKKYCKAFAWLLLFWTLIIKESWKKGEKIRFPQKY